MLKKAGENNIVLAVRDRPFERTLTLHKVGKHRPSQGINPGNRNKGKGKGAGLAWETQSHCLAGKFGKLYTHSFGTDTQHDYSEGNCRTMLSIIIKLELRLV